MEIGLVRFIIYLVGSFQYGDRFTYLYVYLEFILPSLTIRCASNMLMLSLNSRCILLILLLLTRLHRRQISETGSASPCKCSPRVVNIT